MKIRLNPDQKYVKEIRRQLKENSGYCPCSLLKSEDTNCLCKQFRDMDSGMCQGGLYIKEDDLK